MDLKINQLLTRVYQKSTESARIPQDLEIGNYSLEILNYALLSQHVVYTIRRLVPFELNIII